MQEAAFRASHLAARYELWETTSEALAARLAALRSPDVLGANVTIPHKTGVLPLLDAATPESLYFTRAVNTITLETTSSGIRLIGHNTDVPALQRVLREQDAWSAGKRLTVLGAGGAAQAAVAVALLEGADPWIVARLPATGRNLLAAFAPHRLHLPGGLTADRWDDQVVDLADTKALLEVLAETSVLIQATPVGTRSRAASPLPLPLLKQLPSDAFVFDMVYNPPETALIGAALALGLRASGGLPMLLYQGAAAFTLWTGLPAPLDQMRAALGQ
jgi:shikimate dehydrogenase